MKNNQSKLIEYQPISKLLFDPQNPRIPTTRQGDNDSEIIDYMIIKENLFDIVGSIGDQGYFPGEPLLVVPEKKRKRIEGLIETGNFIVVEGNRRLAALKLLNDFSLATVRQKAVAQLLEMRTAETPKEVPVIVFKKRDELLDYLGYRHITGVDQWDSLMKARFLNQLKNVHQENFTDEEELYRHLAKIIGSRSDYVKKLLIGFQLYKDIEDNDFYGIDDLDEEEFSFSLLTTAVSYNNIQEFVEVKIDSGDVEFNSDNLKKLTKYIYEPYDGPKARIPESRDLKTFNAIVANKEAFAAFEQGSSLEEAEVYTDEPQVAFENLLKEGYQKLKAGNDILHRIREFDNPKFALERIEYIQRITKDMKLAIQSRIKRKED